MNDAALAEGGIAPTILRRLAARPERGTRVVAKTISRVQAEVVVPRAADPAVLVDLHSDRRLSLQRLATETDTVLADSYTVTALATGCIELTPTPTDPESDGDIGPGIELRVDSRNRLRLSEGIAHRLGVEVGGKVLVTLASDCGALRLLSLATLADAFEARLAASPDDALAPGRP